MTTMRAVLQDGYGGPEVLYLGGRELPEPDPTEVRVRVRVAGVNPVDWKTRSGAGMSALFGPPPFVLGWDVAGVVDAVGLGVTRFAVGDEVFGMPLFPRPAGAYAEAVTAPSRHFVQKPAGLSFLEAGALPLAWLTAWQAVVEVAAVGEGQRVLVHAAAGGVGHLAVQIAKARGAQVIGTASAAKHAFLTGLGVDEVIDYRAVRFEDVLTDVDAVVDLVGGEIALRSLGVLKRGGLLVSVPSRLPEGLAAAAAAAGCRMTGMLVEPDHVGLEQVEALLSAHRLVVAIEESFPLEQAGAAHVLSERASATGKIVLTT
jgi:NADPH:quinone reductase-like Zn-dependent oxidoreductase